MFCFHYSSSVGSVVVNHDNEARGTNWKPNWYTTPNETLSMCLLNFGSVPSVTKATLVAIVADREWEKSFGLQLTRSKAQHGGSLVLSVVVSTLSVPSPTIMDGAIMATLSSYTYHYWIFMAHFTTDRIARLQQSKHTPSENERKTVGERYE